MIPNRNCEEVDDSASVIPFSRKTLESSGRWLRKATERLFALISVAEYMLCECPPGGRVKNRYKYSLIFLTGVDMTHACICRYRCGFVGAAAQMTAGPGLRLAYASSPSSPPYRARRKSRVTTYGEESPRLLRVFLFHTTAGPYSPFHHCAPVSPGTGITPRREQTP